MNKDTLIAIIVGGVLALILSLMITAMVMGVMEMISKLLGI